MKKTILLGATMAAALLLASVPFSFQWSPTKTLPLILDTADARIGRPLTATSVAGVHRRLHRRASYSVTLAAGAAGAAAYYHYGRPACGHYPYRPCY